MMLRYHKILMALIVMASASCAQGFSGSDKLVYHILEFGNDGEKIVTDIVVKYGDHSFPQKKTPHQSYEPVHRASFSEAHAMRVPETATALWTSADGQKHEVVFPVKTLIDDFSRFHGFTFFFVDDHIVVYAIYRVKGWPKKLDVETKKVFSSKEPSADLRH